MIRFRLTVILRRFWVTERWEVWLIWFLSLKWMSSFTDQLPGSSCTCFSAEIRKRHQMVLRISQDGIPAHIKIDMATQNTELVKLEKGMKYTTSDHFFNEIFIVI